MSDVRSATRQLLATELAGLPMPAEGGTGVRWLALHEAARIHDVSVARLAEAHLDGEAILHEAGLVSTPDAVHGVWASAGDVRLRSDETISGTAPFCSGIGTVDRPLVRARDERDRIVLVEVVLDGDTYLADGSSWRTSALAGTSTAIVTFSGHPVVRMVGGPGWYLDRPGFWHGAVGPAACWAGAAAGLVDVAEERADASPHGRTHLGAMRALAWGMRAVLSQAGNEADADPSDTRAARMRALAVRHLVERSATEVLDRFGRMFGPRPLVADSDVHQRWEDTHLYIRQHHAENDLQALGEI